MLRHADMLLCIRHKLCFILYRCKPRSIWAPVHIGDATVEGESLYSMLRNDILTSEYIIDSQILGRCGDG